MYEIISFAMLFNGDSSVDRLLESCCFQVSFIFKQYETNTKREPLVEMMRILVCIER